MVSRRSLRDLLHQRSKYGHDMTSSPQEPVNAAEEEPAGESVAGLVTSEDDLPESGDGEVEVGLGPEG